MAYTPNKKRERSLRDDREEKAVKLPRAHRKFVLALLEAAICEGVPFYVNKVTRNGKLSLKLFTEDEILASFITPDDDPAACIGDLANGAFSSGLAKEVLQQGAALEAQERLRDAKPKGAE